MILDWIRKKEVEINKQFGANTRLSLDTLATITDVALNVGDFRWAELSRQRQQPLPTRVQIYITRFMLRYNLLGKGRRHHLQKMEALYDSLEIGFNAPSGLNSNFVLLCRNKVDNCIQTKARAIRRLGLGQEEGEKIWWQPITDYWLLPGWDGIMRRPAIQETWIERTSPPLPVGKQRSPPPPLPQSSDHAEALRMPYSVPYVGNTNISNFDYVSRPFQMAYSSAEAN